MQRLLALSSASLLSICVAAAQPPVQAKAPTIDQSLEMVNVSNPRISPDGARVVYEQTRTNWDANEFNTDLWIADVATGERHQLSAGPRSSTAAAWSPDGKWIAFLSDRPAPLPESPKEKQQLYVMPASGGEAQQITKMEKGVEEFDWAPDSKRIAVKAESPDTKEIGRAHV